MSLALDSPEDNDGMEVDPPAGLSPVSRERAVAKLETLQQSISKQLPELRRAFR